MRVGRMANSSERAARAGRRNRVLELQLSKLESIVRLESRRRPGLAVGMRAQRVIEVTQVIRAVTELESGLHAEQASVVACQIHAGSAPDQDAMLIEYEFQALVPPLDHDNGSPGLRKKGAERRSI